MGADIAAIFRPQNDNNFTVIVPTINSARWIGLLHDYYADIGVSPLYVVDSRSEESTSLALKALGANYVVLDNTAPRVEGFIFKFKELVDTEWILRMDDDECPSRDLVEWLRSTRCEFALDVVAFIRRWLRFKSGTEIEYAANSAWDRVGSTDGEDRQYRLWRKDKVEYRTDIHTAGFSVSGVVIWPPSNCMIYHLDWIMRTKEQRMAKMENYDAQRPGAGSATRTYYLHEDIQDWDFIGEVHDDRVRKLANELADQLGTRVR